MELTPKIRIRQYRDWRTNRTVLLGTYRSGNVRSACGVSVCEELLDHLIEAGGRKVARRYLAKVAEKIRETLATNPERYRVPVGGAVELQHIKRRWINWN